MNKTVLKKPVMDASCIIVFKNLVKNNNLIGTEALVFRKSYL